MLNFLFFRQSESIRTINFVVNLLYGKIPMTLIFGLGLAVAAVAVIFFSRKKEQAVINRRLLSVVLVFWLLAAINFFFNNLNDYWDNGNYAGKNLADRQAWRLCEISQKNPASCYVFALKDSAEKNIPRNSTIYVIGNPIVSSYIYYFFYPAYRSAMTAESADYVVYFYPDNRNMFFDGSVFYEVESDGSHRIIGRYSLAWLMDKNSFILKRIK